MLKKGQITVFFIVGVLLLLVVFIANEVNNQEQSVVLETPTELSPTTNLQTYVDACVAQVGEDAIYHALLQGGYYFSPFSSLQFLNADIPIYWEGGEDFMPSLSDIEAELSFYVEQEIFECLNDFAPFKEQGYHVITTTAEFSDEGFLEEDFIEEEFIEEDFIEDDFLNEEIEEDYEYENVQTTIGNGKVHYRASYPTTLEKDGTSFTLSEFSGTVDIDVQRMYSIVQEILAQQAQVPNSLPIGYLADRAAEYDFTFEVLHYDGNTVIVALIFDVENNDEVIYSFVNRYDWEDVEEEEDLFEEIGEPLG